LHRRAEGNVWNVVIRIDTDRVRELADEGAQLLEVLPENAFRREHLPGAVNIPLPGLTEDAVAAAGLDPRRATVVYCYDHECDLSARGAALLEAFGFADVYDYVASKVAWLGEGLPVEGTVSPASRAGAIAREVETCSIDESVGALLGRFGPDGLCVVVDRAGTVLGVVRSEVKELDDQATVRTVMQPAPPSVRPSITARELATNMDHDGRSYVLVTSSHGRLFGIVAASDLRGHH
jgi:rhodanese-related sulfurtransferase